MFPITYRYLNSAVHFTVALIVLAASVAAGPTEPPGDETPLAAVERFAVMLNSPRIEERNNAADALRVMASEKWDEASYELAMEALARGPSNAVGRDPGSRPFSPAMLTSNARHAPWVSAVLLRIVPLMLQSTMPEKRKAGLYLISLNAITNQNVGTLVTPLLEDTDAEVRSMAARTILFRLQDDPAAQSNLLASATRQLRSPRIEERKAALTSLSPFPATNRNVLSMLEPLLEDPDLDFREKATEALLWRRWDDPDAQSNLVAILRRQLESGDAEARLRAARGLAVYVGRSKAQATAQSIPSSALTTLNSADAARRESAPGRTTSWREDALTGEIEKALTKATGDADPRVALSATVTLGEFQPKHEPSQIPDRLVAAFVRCVEHPDPEVRESGLRAVEEIQRPLRTSKSTYPDGSFTVRQEPPFHLNPRIRDAVVAALEDDSPAVRQLAALMVARDQELLATKSKEVGAAMIRNFSSTNTATRRSAFSPLEEASWLSLDDESRRRLAIFWRKELGTTNAIDLLTALGLNGDSSFAFHGSSFRLPIQLLAGSDGDPVAPFLPMMRSSEPALRAAACRMFQDRATTVAQSLAPLPKLCEELAADPWPQVSIAALNVLGAMAARAHYTDPAPVVVEARDRLATLLRTSRLLTRARIPSRVSGTPDAIEAFLTPALNDPDALVRLQSVRALNANGGGVPPAMLNDPDPLVRSAAAMAAPGRSTKSLLTALQSGDPGLRRDAAVGLTRTASSLMNTNEGLVDQLFGALAENYRGETPAAFRELNQAIVSLVPYLRKEPQREKFQTFLRAALRNTDPFQRAGAWALVVDFNARRGVSRQGPAQAVLDENPALLLEAIRSSNATVRVTAFQLLEMLMADPEGARGAFTNPGPELGRAVVKALKDPEPVVVFAAANSLVGLTMEPTPLARSLMQDESSGREMLSALDLCLDNCPQNYRGGIARSLAVLAAEEANIDLLAKALRTLLTTKPGFPPFSGLNSFRETRADVCISRVVERSEPDVICSIALRGRHEAARRLAMEHLISLLKKNDSRGQNSIFNTLAALLRNGALPHPNEFQPLASVILPLLTGGNALDYNLRSAGEALASAVSAAPESDLAKEVGGWITTRANAADPAQRVAAMTALSRLSRQGQSASRAIFPGAWDPAVRLTADTNAAVRAAAFQGLRALSTSSSQRASSADATVLRAGLKDNSTEVKSAAIQCLVEMAGRSWPQEALVPLADDFLAALQFLQPVEMRNQFSLHFAVEHLVPYARSGAAQTDSIDALKRLATQAKATEDQLEWYQLLGEVELALKKPGDALASFTQALTFATGNARWKETALKGLSAKARFAAGDRSDVLDDDVLLRDGGELNRRLEELARTGELENLRKTTSRLLDRQSLPMSRERVLDLTEQALLRRGKEADLEQFLDQELARRSEDVLILTSLAKRRTGQNKTNEAIALYDRALLASKGNNSAEELHRLCDASGQPDRFESSCRHVLDLNPAAFAASKALAEHYMKTRRTNEARSVAASFEKNPGTASTPARWHQTQLAEILEIVGDYDGAIAAFRKAIESEGRSQGAKYLIQSLVELCVRAGKTNELARLQQTSPEMASQVLQKQLEDQTKAGKFDAARATAEQLLAFRKSPAEQAGVWNLLFRDLLMGKASQPRLRMLNEMTAKYPDAYSLPAIFGQYYQIKSDWARAAQYTEQAYQLAPDNGQIVWALASIYLRQGEPHRTVQLIVQFEKTNAARYFGLERHLADSYAALRDTNSLEQMASRLRVKIDGQTAQASGSTLRDLARTESYLGHHQQAVDLLRQAMADPNSLSWGITDLPILAGELERAGQPDAAIAAYQRLSKQNSASAYAHFQLGRLYRRLGQTNEAETSFEASRQDLRQKVNSGRASAADYNSLAWFYVENQIKPQDAVTFARRAVSMQPKDLTYADTLGWALLRRGDYAEAFNQFGIILTNEATGASLVNSAWNAVNALVASEAPPSLFSEFEQKFKHALPLDDVSQVWLMLLKAHFENEHGDPAKAVELRADAGTPDERKWLILGPFPDQNNLGPLRAYIPEDAKEIDRQAGYPGWKGAVRWEAHFDGHADGVIEFDRIFPGTDEAVAYAWTTIECDNEQSATLNLGSDDQSKVWLNGHSVLRRSAAGSFRPDQQVVEITLRKGINSVLVKVCNGQGNWKFIVRLTDPAGQRLEGVRL